MKMYFKTSLSDFSKRIGEELLKCCEIKIQTNAVTPINGRTFPPHNIRKKMHKILHPMGMRCSETAVSQMSEELGWICLEISKLAVENAHRNGRREVLEEDIHEALRVFDGG